MMIRDMNSCLTSTVCRHCDRIFFFLSKLELHLILQNMDTE